MKITIKILCLLLSVFLLIPLAACGKISQSSSAYVMKLDDLTISEGEYSYILAYIKSNVIYSYQSYLYQYTGQVCSEEELLSMVAYDDVTVADYITEYAKDFCQHMLIIEKLCKDSNISITDESTLNDISDYIADIEYAYGGKDLFDIKLLTLGFERSGIERFERFNSLFDLFYDYRYGDNGTSRVSDEAVLKYFSENYYRYDGSLFSYTDDSGNALTFEYSDDEAREYFDNNFVKITHVLYLTVDSQGNELSAEVIAEKKQKAEAAYEAIVSGEKTIEDFSSENEDSGSEYIFTYGAMVEEFENAAFEMKAGDVRLVKTEYGFHIMQKSELTDDDFYDKEVDGNTVEGYKNTVIEAMTEEAIRAEAKALIEQYNNGDIDDLPEEIVDEDYYTFNSAALIDKNDTSYSELIEILSELEENAIAEKDFTSGKFYIIRRLTLSEEDITTDVSSTIREDLSQQQLSEYVESYYDKIEINSDSLDKFNVETVKLLDDEFLYD